MVFVLLLFSRVFWQFTRIYSMFALALMFLYLQTSGRSGKRMHKKWVSTFDNRKETVNSVFFCVCVHFEDRPKWCTQCTHKRKETTSQLIMSMCLHFNFAWNYARISDNNNTFGRKPNLVCKNVSGLISSMTKPKRCSSVTLTLSERNQNDASRDLNDVLFCCCYFIAAVSWFYCMQCS